MHKISDWLNKLCKANFVVINVDEIYLLIWKLFMVKYWMRKGSLLNICVCSYAHVIANEEAILI
jgi:hypothetical protein